MAIRLVRLGSPRAPGEGLRLGTVRRPPRGVPKRDFAKRDYYDVWLPELAPSAELVSRVKGTSTASDWQRFVRHYRTEMNKPEARRLLVLLAALSHQTNLAVGCYCKDASRCHRSVLRQLLIEHRAAVAD